MTRSQCLCRLVAPVLALLLWPSAATAAAPAFRIYVEEAGVYAVSYEDLREAGLELDAVDSRDLALTHRGRDVPIWVDDGGDGRFGPGDHLEFVGEHLSGHRSYYNEHTDLNVYRLATDRVATDGTARMTSPAPPEIGRPTERAALEVRRHLEEERVWLRFASVGEETPEPWYWARLTHVDPQPFEVPLPLRSYRAASPVPIHLAIHLQGWSAAGRSRDLPDHRVEVLLNGEPVGSGEWDGEAAHLIEIPAVPAGIARPGKNLLELKVPRRRPSPEADAVVDVVALNWVEVRYPRRAQLGSRQEPFALSGPAVESSRPSAVRLATAPATSVVVYGSAGSRFDAGNIRSATSAGQSIHTFYPPVHETSFVAVPDGALLPPAGVELDHAAGLKDRERQADYVVIAHPRLVEAIEPLAAFHRQRGLAVTVVRVDDVYDEFNHGILDPEAIRDFLSYAYHQWRPPAPRFVLLVGDASWDTKDSRPVEAKYADWTFPRFGGEQRRFRRMPFQHYDNAREVRHRNLVPTKASEGLQGPGASDNYFVAVAGDDLLPDMAIGRFPVIEPAEVAAIVAKTLRYGSESGVGPWRRNMLWITHEDPVFQSRSDSVAEIAAADGFAGSKIYPSPDQPRNEQHQSSLLEAFDRGQLLVHFLGHGGRSIWRTGYANFRDKNDLFNLDHLDRLAPRANLPLVLSMTCASAPFDHPSADSIGEKFLRLDGSGAVAVVAASWRINAVTEFSELLVEEVTTPGVTVGEAMMRAKRGIKAERAIELYNLLGDPALELALPRHALDLEVVGTAREGWQVVAQVPSQGFSGAALVDWLDGDGEVVHSDRLEVRDATLRAGYRGAPAEPVESVRVYVWNEELAVDGLGALALPSATEPAEPPAPAGASRAEGGPATPAAAGAADRGSP